MGGVGPLIAGALHDATGSYSPAFAVSAALNVLAVGLLLLARPPHSEASPRTDCAGKAGAR